MGTLQDALERTTQQLPRIALATLVKKKLAETGVRPPKKILGALIDHLMSGEAGPFVWDRKDKREIVLDFSEDDIQQLEAAVEQALKLQPIIIESASEQIAGDLLKWLKARWRQQYALESADRAKFRKRLERRWGKALSLLRMMITIARELPDGGVTEGSVIHRHGALFLRLHVRACQVAAEIVSLLENGFADGALARWRTLHEIGVVTAFLIQSGDETIERYEAYGVVEAWRNMEAFLRCREDLGYGDISSDVKAALEAKFEAARALYGKSFGRSYGWAADALGNEYPKFDQIEAAVDRAWQRSHYKLASYNVHAGPHGDTVRLGLLEGSSTLLAGSSNAGLHEPCQNTAFTLAHICAQICGQEPTFDQLVAVKVLRQLADEIPKASAKAELKLKRDHAKVEAHRTTPPPNDG